MFHRGVAGLPNPIKIMASDIFIWVVLEAVIGCVLSAGNPDYVGVKLLFQKYDLNNVRVWVTIPLDLVFLIGLGPIIGTAAYMPSDFFKESQCGSVGHL